jgi:uncharacterized protein
MKQKPDIQLQYEGFLNTPLLWKSKQLEGLVQFEIPPTTLTLFQESIPLKIRLGKLVERFVSHELNQYESIDILRENLQIIENKITIGELDCLLKLEEELIHLEVVYKFYLYDAKHSSQEIARWIGPNRKDSLVQKLKKLKEKQLPILFRKQTKLDLKKLQIDLYEITQKTYFKAQLFVPYPIKTSLLPEINNDCIKGFYIQKSQLKQFDDHTFYIPSKMNWLIDVHNNVSWIAFIDFISELTELLNNEKSPLCWLKDSKGNTKKIFVVWW